MAIFIGTVGADWIDGGSAADDIEGLDGDDTLNGFEGDDILAGGDGHDVLDGGTGADVMRGGAGQDVYYVDDAGDVIVEESTSPTDWFFDTVLVSLDAYAMPDHVEHAYVWWDSGATVYGNRLNNEMWGWFGNDRLEGGAGNDYLFGGSGSDVLVGGTGNDRYHLNDEYEEFYPEVDTVIELPGGGLDTVELWGWSNHILAANVENVEIHSSAITLVANGANNHIRLHGGAMTIDGGAGSDTVSYADTFEQVEVDLLTNIHGGGAADDSFTSIENVTAGYADDVLRGSNGANILDAGWGENILEGRGGNDIYVISNPRDVVIEVAGGGTDEVRLTGWGGVVYQMPDEVERLRLAEGGIAYGNASNNDMFGSADRDEFHAGEGHDSLNGAAGDDLLHGEAGHDMLNGGLGGDEMVGGDGNDAFTVDNIADTVTELAGEGVDIVYASTAAFTLPDHVENLSFNGQGAFAGTGNAMNNIVQGSSGDDVLAGAGGNDELRGGSGADALDGGDGADMLIGNGGADVLTGGAGADRFRFSGYESGTGADADTIVDFTSGEDVIDLSAIDADLWTAGNQAFAFIGDAAFSGTAGELHYAFDGTDGRLQADTDGDGFSDYEIVLPGPLVPVIGDFML